MELKHKISTYIEVDHSDLDDFLTNRFDFDPDYEFVTAEEINDDLEKVIIVEPKLDRRDRKDMEEMLKTKEWECYQTRVMLCYLCQKGEIPAGKYLISVS